MHEPAVFNPKGRPRQQRITGALEGRPRGGGATSASASSRGTAAGRRCGACRELGHTRAKCPHIPKHHQIVTQYLVAMQPIVSVLDISGLAAMVKEGLANDKDIRSGRKRKRPSRLAITFTYKH
ncbi:hypothetical protein BDZ97DRAFT_1838584 [Flammula alnicola]|nr:hypothetical protein BDZ97DRAFT_1838584 [Flammula alnicola]